MYYGTNKAHEKKSESNYFYDCRWENNVEAFETGLKVLTEKNVHASLKLYNFFLMSFG